MLLVLLKEDHEYLLKFQCSNIDFRIKSVLTHHHCPLLLIKSFPLLTLEVIITVLQKKKVVAVSRYVFVSCPAEKMSPKSR